MKGGFFEHEAALLGTFSASIVCPFWVLALETIDAAQRRFLYAPHFHNRTMHG